MKKTLLVMKNEIITVISRPSFWIAALGLPLIAGLIFAGVGALNKNGSTAGEISQVFTEPQESRPEGYVDLSGLLQEMPETIPPGTFVAFSDETSARLALEAGQIAAFYLVPADYLQSGEITYVRPDFNPFSSSGEDQSGLFTWALQVNLAGGDWFFANLVSGPLYLDEVSLAPVAAPDEDNPLAMWAPYAITLVFYFLIISSASVLLGTITKEKENRIMEMLLTSVTPRQMLVGKIAGLGVVGLGQTILWMGTTFVLLNLSGRTFRLPEGITLDASFLAWGLVFFLLGYAVYASLMAGLGALAPNLREASQATFVIMLPMMIPLFLSNSVFMQAPHGVLATTLSLFPLSAPVAMMARLVFPGVAWWQPWLAVLLLAGTVIVIVRAVAGMFRAQALLSGQGFKLKAYFRALVGKE